MTLFQNYNKLNKMCWYPWTILMFRLVFGETIEWGFHSAMVDEVDIIQGREHIKGMVVMVGESIELECQVGFTNQNVSHIIYGRLMVRLKTRQV